MHVEKAENNIRKRKVSFPETCAVLILCIGTVLFALLFILLPDREFSDNENRMLASCPVPGISSVLDGSFQDAFETYLADQFPARDKLFAFSVRAHRILGSREINEVFLCGDRLIDVYEPPQNTEKFVAAVERLKDNLTDARVILLLVPTASDICGSELPRLSAVRMPVSQEETLAQIREAVSSMDGASVQQPDVKEVLRDAYADGESLYYRTDHHWTTRGALVACRELAGALGLAGELPSGEQLTEVSRDFYGTTWSKVCDPGVPPDTIEIYENPAWQGRIHVTYTDSGAETDTPYNREYLKKKDQYSLFLDNLHPLITIENPDADLRRTDGEERRALAVVKDSYANCLIPFLIDHYETIYVFDPRYYRGGISSFVNEHDDIRDVVILYNLQTMDTDRGIGAID